MTAGRWRGRIRGVAAAAAVIAAAAGSGCGPGPRAEPPAPAPGAAAPPDAAGADSAADSAAAAHPAEAPPPDAAGRTDPSPAVARIELRLDPTSPRVGDTVRVDARALDAEGRLLDDEPLRVRAPPRLLVPVGDTMLIAVREGDGTVRAEPAAAAGADADPAPAAGADAEPAPAARDVPRATLPVSVRPAPLATLTLDAPVRMYAGSSARVRARASTAYGPRERTPPVTWSTSDADVLAVSAHGTVTAVAPGEARLEARAEGISASAPVRVVPNPAVRLELLPAAADAEAGEVIHFSASVLDAGGAALEDAAVAWAMSPPPGEPAPSAGIDAAGAFVAGIPGLYGVVATFAGLSARAEVEVRPRPAPRPVDVVARRAAPPGTAFSALRVFEGVDGRTWAYVGTRGPAKLHAWDVTDPARPVLRDSVVLSGRRVTDIETTEDATLAVVTLAAPAPDGDGIALLDILDPAGPRLLAPPPGGRGRGVRGAWIEQGLVYAARAGDEQLQVIDISDPTASRVVGRWAREAPGGRIEDVSVRDGLAYVAYGDDGLVVLDVGAGVAGGSPAAPALVARHAYAYTIDGEVHGHARHALRDRYRVFVADESEDCRACVGGPRGYVHVIDVADVERPVAVAYYRVPEAGARDLWVEDDVLYVAYGQAGVRAVDVSGELRGDLWGQGREIGRMMGETGESAETGGVPLPTMTDAVQRHGELLFAVDRHSGLWILRLGGAP